MTKSELSRVKEGLDSAGWTEEQINDFILYIESGDEKYKPQEVTDNKSNKE